MKQRIIQDFKYESKGYLSSLSLGKLRVYGRKIGVANPTELRKEELIEAIIAVLCGEASPVEPSKKGAPVKEDHVDPKIEQSIDEIYNRILLRYSGEIKQRAKENPLDTSDWTGQEEDFATRLEKFQATNKVVLCVEDPKYNQGTNHKEYIGQLQTVNNVPWLLPLDCTKTEERIIVPVEMIRLYDLREGDTVTCRAEMSRTSYVATEILTINGFPKEALKRGKFAEMDVCAPYQRIFTESETQASRSAKFFEWLCPIGKGQRTSVVAAPKTGKTELLYEFAENVIGVSQAVCVLVLLVGQSPETVGRYRKLLNRENLAYTTYEDSPERQVFVADFILKRAKSLAESGKDVILVVDSLSALAKAYNETDYSTGGKVLLYGLESKTLHYIKQYFGSARCFEKGGSLTIVGGVVTGTGNPVDEMICSDLLGVGNQEIRLSETLCRQKRFPAVDYENTKLGSERLSAVEEQKAQSALMNVLQKTEGAFDWQTLLDSSKNILEFYKAIKN